MVIALSTSSLKRAKWYEYLIRFILGGLVTVVAGLLANKVNPSFGGLFLAFPAILAASTTLVEKHEREKKEQKGLPGLYRGRLAAGADAAGAAMGSIGLFMFALVVWTFLPNYAATLVITGATLIWGLVAFAVWWLWKRNLFRDLRRILLQVLKPRR